MFFNIKEIRKNDISKDLLLDLIESLYNNVNNNKAQNIILNEYVQDLIQDQNILNQYSFTLSKIPVSLNDISIISEDGELLLTPKNIVEINNNKITIKSNKVKTGINFYVTYKH